MKNAFSNIRESYYATTIDDRPTYPKLDGTVTADVCVVGGGLAGINTSLGLIARGKSVAVLEAEYIGYGASGRNAGFVAKGYSAGEASLADKLGVAKAQELVTLTKNARKLIRQRVQELNITCGPMIDGVLTVSWKDDAAATQSYIDKANENFDLGFEYWPTEKVRQHCKTEKYYNGVFSPHDFQMNPLQYLVGIARALAQRGGKIFEHSKVDKIDRVTDGFVIKTATGVVKAEQVVMCCSVYSDGLDRRLENAVIPVQTYIMVTERIAEEDYAASLNSPYAIYDNRFCSDYYRRLPEGRLLWGGRVSLFGAPSNIAQAMMSDILKVYPQLENKITPAFAWSGLLAYAPHKMPQLGELEKGYWYNSGFGGHGLCPTTAAGEVIAAAVATGDDSYKKFAPFGVGFAGGKMAKFGAQGVYLWWRARDFLGI